MFLLKLSILIGMVVNVYYLYDYARALQDGKLTAARLFFSNIFNDIILANRHLQQ